MTTEINIFEKASRTALRFASSKGELTTEQLWDLPLQSRGGFDLDTIAKAVNRNLKQADEESFVSTRSTLSLTDTLRLDILKHIIAVKVAENAEKRDAAAKAEKKALLLDLLDKKQTESLAALSEEELRKQLKELS